MKKAEKRRIYNVEGKTFDEKDRVEMVQLLAKCGYTVRLGKTKNKSNKYEYYVEYWEE